jgi:hypothetical protein
MDSNDFNRAFSGHSLYQQSSQLKLMLSKETPTSSENRPGRVVKKLLQMGAARSDLMILSTSPPGYKALLHSLAMRLGFVIAFVHAQAVP